MKPRDMTGTARCGECGAEAKHERGPGSPLSIRHSDNCSMRCSPGMNAEADDA